MNSPTPAPVAPSVQSARLEQDPQRMRLAQLVETESPQLPLFEPNLPEDKQLTRSLESTPLFELTAP